MAKLDKHEEEQKLKEFFDEVNKNKEEEKDVAIPASKATVNDQSDDKPYMCPKCRRMLKSRKLPCPYCGYHGYIPMSEKETKKIRWILFFIILAIAIAVYVTFH